MTEYISPYIHGLQKLVNGEGYSALSEMYTGEEKRILRELHNATDDRALRITQGKYILLKRLMALPEDEINKALTQKAAK